MPTKEGSSCNTDKSLSRLLPEQACSNFRPDAKAAVVRARFPMASAVQIRKHANETSMRGSLIKGILIAQSKFRTEGTRNTEAEDRSHTQTRTHTQRRKRNSAWKPIQLVVDEYSRTQKTARIARKERQSCGPASETADQRQRCSNRQTTTLEEKRGAE